MTVLIRGGLVKCAAMLALLFLVGGCDVQTDVVLRPEIKIGSGRLAGKVDALEAELTRQQQRADRLEAEVQRMNEECIVLKTDDGFTFRLNTTAAVVLVFAIVGIVTVLVARMKIGADARGDEDSV